MINMSAMAKAVAAECGDCWVSYMDTYGQIAPETVEARDAEGFDLYQEVDDSNCHLGFHWVRR